MPAATPRSSSLVVRHLVALFVALAVAEHVAAQWAPAPSPPAVGLHGAFEDCPCIDHHNRSGGDPAFFDKVEESGKVQNGQLQLSPVMVAPRDYGSGRCHTFDKGGAVLPECGSFGPPRFCGLKWCYVDPQNCHKRRRPRSSSLLPGLHYSYYTCSNIDNYFTGQTYWSGMAPIHVFAFGDAVSVEAVHEDGTLKALVLFAHQVLAKMQMPESAIVYRALSSESRALFLSDYTACARDVALGHLDLCVGDFWATQERLEMKARFSNTVYQEDSYLYVEVAEEKLDILGHLAAPLQPFTGSLWAIICGVVVAAGLMMAFLDSSEYPQLSKGATVAECSYKTLASFVNAGTTFVPAALPARVFAVGLSFFICVTIASFTGNTTSFLLYQKETTSVQSLREALDAGMTVCMIEAIRVQLLDAYPELGRLGVVLKDSIEVFQVMAEGRCQTGIMGEPWAMDQHSHGRHCQYQAVGRPIISFPTGMFVSDRLQDSFNWAVVERRQDGTWSSLQSRIYPQSMCGAEEDQPRKLQPQHMIGNCGLLLVCFGIALVLKMMRRVEQTSAVQAAEVQFGGVVGDVGSQVANHATSIVPSGHVPHVHVDPKTLLSMLEAPLDGQRHGQPPAPADSGGASGVLASPARKKVVLAL